MPLPRRSISPAVVGSREALRPTSGRNLNPQRGLVQAPRAAPGQVVSRGSSVIDKEKYNRLVVELLKLPGSAKPQDTLRVFVTLVGQIKAETAEVEMTRMQFAEHCGIAGHSVSTAMTNLEKLGLIRREYSGGKVTYFVKAEMLVETPPELPGLGPPSQSSGAEDLAS